MNHTKCVALGIHIITNTNIAKAHYFDYNNIIIKKIVSLFIACNIIKIMSLSL